MSNLPGCRALRQTHLTNFMLGKKGQIFVYSAFKFLSAFSIMIVGQINAMASTLQACPVLTSLHFKHPSFPKLMQVSVFHLLYYSKAH